MINCRWIGLVLCVLIAVSCDFSEKISVRSRTGKMEITSGDDLIIAQPVGQERTVSFLVVGGTGRGMFPFTTHFSVIPLARLQQFLRDYGSFEECLAGGVLDADGNVSSMFLYAGDEKIARTLRKIDDLAMSWHYPVVRLTVVKIDILEDSADLMGQRVAGESAEFQPAFLVKEAVLIRSSYE